MVTGKHGGGVFASLDRRRSEFERLYFIRALALRPVSQKLNVSVKSLCLWMDARDIARRDRIQAQRWRSRHHDKVDEVIRLRLVEHLSLERIAERVGYASKGHIHAILASRGLVGPVSKLPSHERYLKGRDRYGRHVQNPAKKTDEIGETDDSEEEGVQGPGPSPPRRPGGTD